MKRFTLICTHSLRYFETKEKAKEKNKVFVSYVLYLIGSELLPYWVPLSQVFWFFFGNTTFITGSLWI